ncbi:lipopolysaccharide kinase InaA family protein [Persicobacter psychrovividus]|uniref:Protein kinase domain-containing protein n=1 Tax=Persicobacter psychrovividus TaxID=387638 RepID=A0ABM7VDX0_9BACT|nr:hypothetical protein PEPS_12920 [Persicobacter psychrovividus]
MNKVKIISTGEAQQAFLDELHENFNSIGTTLQGGRNEVKVVDCGAQKLCVKSFGKPTLANTFIYSFIRKTKAERSYLHALQLLEMGVDTPQPISYIEVKNRWGILKNAYYISDFDPGMYDVSHLLSTEVEDRALIIDQFIDFVIHDLHAQGILHKDFNGGNILVHKGPERNYRFALIDINRMSFNHEFNRRAKIKNVQSLTSDVDALIYLAKRYAEIEQKNFGDVVMPLLSVKNFLGKKRHYTKKFLHGLKRIFLQKKLQH